MDRYWFYTWQTYGTWLPGEDGFVGYYHSQHGRRVIDNVPGELPTDASLRWRGTHRRTWLGSPSH